MDDQEIAQKLAIVVRDLVRAEVKAALATATADDQIPHPRWGRPIRACCEAAAAGELRAKKIGRYWYATRADVNTWLSRLATEQAPKPENDVVTHALTGRRVRG